jgi:hypothetical protein
MLQEVVRAIMDGQPKLVVVAHSQAYANVLMDELHQMLLNRGIDNATKVVVVNHSASVMSLYGGEQIVRFMSARFFWHWIRGRRGWGEFWDHYAEGEE